MSSINDIKIVARDEAPTKESSGEIHRAGFGCAANVYECFVGMSRHVSELKEFVASRAGLLQPTLLIGERGLRQDQIARALHEASSVAGQPFITINTYTLSEEQIYHLLFSHNNVFKTAWRGTVFLNGLVSLPTMIQQRLAAFLEEMKWQLNREGAKLPRLVISTDWHEGEMTTENRIGYSLVEMLRPQSFTLKPLRERSEDIGPLAIHLLNCLAMRQQTGKYELTAEALKVLAAYHWERNIDELEAVLEAAIAQARPHQIEVNLLPERIRQANFNSLPMSGVNLPQIVDEYERSLIAAALRQTNGSQTKAARLLGLRAQTLNMKLKRLHMHTFSTESSDPLSKY